jgi:hypothetical protein
LFGALSVCRLFCSIAADRHAAPSTRAASSSIDEQKRASRPLARFHIGEVLCADEVGQRSRQGKEKRLRGLPAPLSAPGEAGNSAFLLSVVMFLLVESMANHDLAELYFARQQLIE